MKKRNDKRKIYKYKYKPKKKRKQGRVFRKILSVLVTIVVLCGLVFLGYTIAAPLLRLIDKNKSEQTV
jgi:cell division septal protein FtsQ